ncbi:hypothetical protein P3S68_000312 [Capsicum galapagoense]
MVESIGAISLLGRVPVYGVCYGKDLSSKRKAIDVCGMPSADFRVRKVVCGSYLRRLRADCEYDCINTKGSSIGSNTILTIKEQKEQICWRTSCYCYFDFHQFPSN